jgi:RNA polymerase sigma-70 factor (family 1)
MGTEINDLGDEINILNFKQDKQAAFNYIFKKYYAILCYFAENLLNDASFAEDIVEDLFLNLWKRNTDFSQFASIKAFLYTCVSNACYNQIQQQQRREKRNQTFLNLSQQNNDNDLLNEMIRAEFLKELDEALDQLPPGTRKVIKLIYVEGWALQKIATELDISINTVKSHRAKGILLLRRKINALPPLLLMLVQFKIHC